MLIRALIYPALLLAIALSVPARAVTIEALPLSDLVTKSDMVALVEIRSGELIEADGEPCGAAYNAKILTPLKGEIAAGDTIKFGPERGHEIGRKYLVFLTAKGKRLSAVSSYTSSMMRPAAEFARRCAKAFPDNYETLEGGGTLLVLDHRFDGREREVVVDEMLLTPPETLNKRVADLDSVERLYHPTLLSLEKTMTLLRSLVDSGANAQSK